MNRGIPSAVACFALLALVVSGGTAVQALAQTPSKERQATGRQPAAPGSVDPRKFVQVVLPPDVPLEVVGVDYGQSRISKDKDSLEIDLHLTLTLRNLSNKSLEGLALALGYQAEGRGTEALNAVSGIRVGAGDTYSIPARMRAEIELAPQARRPGAPGLPANMQVRLDSVLFSDGSGYGPDLMRALVTMRVNQAEAARDRNFLRSVFQVGGVGQLVPALERWGTAAAEAADRLAHSAPRVLAGDSAERARSLAQFADFRVVRFSRSPLEIISARARVFEGGLVDPSIEVRNTSGQEITDFQLSWVLRDATGNEFRVATISPSAGSPTATPFRLPAGDSLTWRNPTVVGVRRDANVPILSGRVYLRAVQFADGRVWVPDRSALEIAGGIAAAGHSTEIVRLFRIYQTRGVEALLAELRR